MEYNNTNEIEVQELIKKLKNKGYEKFINMLLDNENKIYTKKGRLNKSSICRVLGWKSKQLEDALKECKDILGNELEL